VSALVSPFLIHKHWLIKDHRSPSVPIRHSHADGQRGHLHPTFGPSFYGYGGPPKTSKRALGEQLPYTERSAEDAFFDVFLCDGALMGTPDGMRLLTDADLQGDGPNELEGFVRAGSSVEKRMETGFDLTARFHDHLLKENGAAEAPYADFTFCGLPVTDVTSAMWPGDTLAEYYIRGRWCPACKLAAKANPPSPVEAGTRS
jgi:hypothetical protein